MKSNKLMLLLVGVLALQSCTKDPEDAKPTIPSEELFKSGIYIVNEGNFGANNATIDLFSKDSNKLYSNIFNLVNGRPLGDVAQSMTLKNGKGYIVLNGSAKVEVIDLLNASSIGTITGFSSPRYMVALDSNTAYVSDWVSNSVKEINLQSLTIVQSIPVGTGPENMAIVNKKLFVCNSGGFSDDSSISVINTQTKEEIARVVVGDAPTAIAVDKNNRIWVLCRGSYGPDFISLEDDTYAKLVCINADNYSIIKTFSIGTKGDHPDKMKINKSGDALYYLGSYNFNSGLYKHGIDQPELSIDPIRLGYYYGLGYDRVDGSIYLADPIDFVQRGDLYKINESGAIVDSYKVGIIPNGISEQ